MRYILTILFFFVATNLSAQTVRLPEPVPSAAARMFEQLESGDWILQAEALDYLSRYDVPGVVEPVRAILDNDRANRWLRGRALVALSRIEPANAATLAETHTKGGIPELRAAAAEICVDLPADKAAPIIERLLAENTPLVHFHALAAHARHRGESAWEAAEPRMETIPDNCIEPAARTLGWIGTEAALAKLREIADQEKNRPALLRGLEGVNNPALVPFYVELFALSKGNALLAEAWQALGKFKRDTIVAACRKALASGDEKYVLAVARIAARYLKEPVWDDALQAALKDSKDLATLRFGLAALSCIEADRFQDFFTAHLTHDDALVRATAIGCLAQCKEVNLYETLESTLGDSESAIRVAVLESLRNAPREQAPRERIIEYFTPSLLSPDAATRKAAVAALSPAITMDNAEAALGVMRKMQNQYGAAGTEPLMRAVFRMVPEEESAEILEAQGYVAHWHVIGAFPAGFGAPDKDVDGLATVYPPEKKVDLNETITVKYNTASDTRSVKKVAEEKIGWVPLTVGNADGVLFMTKAVRSQLQMPRRNGVCYAYTEISVPAKTDVRLSFLFNMKAGDRVWLNGKVLSLASKVDKKQGTATKTAQVTLGAGKNRFLIKVASNDSSPARWAPKVSTRGFALSLTDPDGKPVKWSNK